MINQVRPFIFEGQQVRTVVITDTPYFFGKDVARILGYQDLSRAVNQHVDLEDRKSLSRKESGDSCLSLWDNDNDWTDKTIITESGVYSLIFSSKLPSAKQFKRWVTHEVLPSIRKNGMYATPQAAEQLLNNPDMMIEILTRYKDSQAENQRLHDENTIMQPKALFADAVATSHTSILVGELAKLIQQNGINIGPNRLFKWMRDNGYLIKRKGTDWNMPTQRSMQMKLFEVKERSFQNPDGSVRVTKTPKVTGKGQQYFINKFLNGQDEEVAL
jgi:anti-repressor protein